MSVLSLADVLLPGPSCLRLTDISTSDAGIWLELSATRVAVACPSCSVLSSDVHSLYQRTVVDLPWAGIRVTLHLHVRRFVCRHSSCPRVTFSEPLPEVVAPSARRSLRLADEQRKLGLQVGGSGAARIAQRQGMPVSPATILRLVRRTQLAERATPSLLGGDEWAYRKRLDFKTILVDLSTNRPLELLPDANATTLASWLQNHPGVEVIARDRAGTFAEGARQGAPDAIQVADRFHLMQNLRTAIEEIVKRMVDVRQVAAEALAEQANLLQPSAGATTPGDGASANTPLPLPDLQRARDPYRKRVQEQRRAQRLARYEQVLALHQAGALQQEIAERLQITRATVSRYLKARGFPEREPYPRLESKLDPYHAYLTERWAAGEMNGRKLWQELQTQGFEGSLMTVMRWAARQQLLSAASPTSRRGHKGQTSGQPEQVVAPLRTRRVAWWLLRRPDTLSTGHQAVLARMEQASPAFGQLYRLSVQFTEMLRKRQVEQLRPWLQSAKASDLKELKSLAEGMERDEAAVEAALRLPYSTGPVEGNINRLKLIKRSGYGRAGFDLLRLRVLET
jgi:transposase